MCRHGGAEFCVALPDATQDAARVKAEEFLEHAKVHEHYYGTRRKPLVTNLQNGVDVLIDVDIQGAAAIRAFDDQTIRQALCDVFIMPPDLDELRRRLTKRGTETAKQIELRIVTAAREMALWRDYRYTIMKGIFSNQLLQRNSLYGFDPVEMYTMIYYPKVAEGMVLRIGRYISPPDIEAQLTPDNYLFSHSLMFSVDPYTFMGINPMIRLSKQWEIMAQVHAGNDTAIWSNSASSF